MNKSTNFTNHFFVYSIKYDWHKTSINLRVQQFLWTIAINEVFLQGVADIYVFLKLSQMGRKMSHFETKIVSNLPTYVILNPALILNEQYNVLKLW